MTCDRIQEGEIDFAMNHKKCIYCAADDFEDLMITCSIGAAYSPNNGHEYEELFKKADYCLYVAKEKGRDRYVFFASPSEKQVCPNKAACWSPAAPAIGIALPKYAGSV